MTRKKVLYEKVNHIADIPIGTMDNEYQYTTLHYNKVWPVTLVPSYIYTITKGNSHNYKGGAY